MKKILPSIYALVFSAGLIAFAVWFLVFFESGKIYRTASGIVDVHQLKSFDPLTSDVSALGYKIKLKGIDSVFVLRMYGEDFNLERLDKQLSDKAEIEITFHPLPNEHREYDIYRITQRNSVIYTFNKKFNPNSSKTFGWLALAAGCFLFLIGIYSLVRRMRS